MSFNIFHFTDCAEPKRVEQTLLLFVHIILTIITRPTVRPCGYNVAKMGGYRMDSAGPWDM